MEQSLKGIAKTAGRSREKETKKKPEGEAYSAAVITIRDKGTKEDHSDERGRAAVQMLQEEGYEIADERESWAEIGVVRHGASYFGRLSIDFDTRAWEGQPRDTYSFDSSGGDRMYHDLFADRWVLTGYSDSFNLNPADPSAACVFLMDRFEMVRVEGSLVLYAD